MPGRGCRGRGDRTLRRALGTGGAGLAARARAARVVRAARTGTWWVVPSPAPSLSPAANPLPCRGSVPAAQGVPVARADSAARGRDGYEEDPTLPWWDLLDAELSRRPAGPRTPRLLLYAALLAVAILLAAVVGAVTLG